MIATGQILRKMLDLGLAPIFGAKVERGSGGKGDAQINFELTCCKSKSYVKYMYAKC